MTSNYMQLDTAIDIVCYVLNLFALVNTPRVIFRTAFIHYLLISIIACLDLQHFLRFITGSCLLPQGPCRIDVLFSDDDEGCIFASTCLLQLHVPRHFESYEGFKAAMKAFPIHQDRPSILFKETGHDPSKCTFRKMREAVLGLLKLHFIKYI